MCQSDSSAQIGFGVVFLAGKSGRGWAWLWKCLVVTCALESQLVAPCSNLTSSTSFTQACAHNLQLGPLSSSPLSTVYCHISCDMLTEVGPIALNKYRGVRLTVGSLSQGTIHQMPLHCTSCEARACLQVLVWLLQYGGEGKECLCCSSIFLVSG